MKFSITKTMNKAISFLSSVYDAKNKIKNLLQEAPPIILGDIKLELVSEFSESYENDVPMITLDDGSQITDNISMNPRTLSFKVQLAGDNHNEMFEKIIELRNKREMVNLYLGKLYENLAITSVEKTVESTYYTEFTINLVEIKIAHLSLIPTPSKKAAPVVKPTAKVKTNSTKKDWEGELASEKIQLPGDVK